MRNWNPEVWCEMEKRLRPVYRQSNLELVIFPKNRDKEALILEGSIQENIVLPLLPSLEHGTFVNPAAEKNSADKEIDSFRIKCNSGKQWVSTLSGGNKQKVSLPSGSKRV